MKKIYILGVGYNTPVSIELAMACGYDISGLFHYETGRTGEYDHGIEILGTHEDLLKKSTLEGMNFMLSMGNNETRQLLSKQIKERKGNLPSLIHPSSDVSVFSTIEEGVYIYSHTAIQANVKISKNTLIQNGVVICHNSNIGENCFIAPNSTIGAYTKIENNVFIGLGAVTISSKVEKIGSHACIGAGSVVTKSVDAYAVVAGNPARKIK